MNSVASSLSTARVEIFRKNPTGVNTILKAGDCTIDGINIEIIQENIKFS
jgi:hypothetical protein